ncbi:hypothetical protein [Klebsiella phage phiKp_32]|nr:hypothetical protein [Klebsiella phage phiKp_32]
MNNDHIELVFDGLYDRVSGNETYASRYLGGVLWANEPSRMFVSGNEGFVDTVSDGIKKAWEYIKGIFKKIFGWFSSKSPEQKKSEIEKQSNSLKSDIERFLSSSDLKIAQRVYPRMIDAIKRDEGFPNRSAILAEVERLQSISPKISLGEIGLTVFKKYDVPFPKK